MLVRMIGLFIAFVRIVRIWSPGEDQGPVVQKKDNPIHWINLHPLDIAIVFLNVYPLDNAIQRLYYAVETAWSAAKWDKE